VESEGGMRISLIKDHLVDAGKGGNLAFVSEVWTLRTLEEFAFVASSAHIAPAVFAENKRDGDHFRSIDFLCFDFDAGIQTAHQVHTSLCDRLFNHVLIASQNHLKDKGDGKGIIERFHLFIPLSKPIEDRSLYRFAVKKLATQFGWSIDPACTDATRYFYRHGETLFLKENLKPLDTDWIESMKRHEDQKRVMPKIGIRTQVPKEKGSSVETFQGTRAWRLLTKEMSADGQRYANSAIIVGTMKKCGLTCTDAIALFDQYATWGTSFSRQSVERMFREFD
jgi:hypothetical protein